MRHNMETVVEGIYHLGEAWCMRVLMDYAVDLGVSWCTSHGTTEETLSVEKEAMELLETFGRIPQVREGFVEGMVVQGTYTHILPTVGPEILLRRQLLAFT
jgi:hypothetical protein